MPSTSPDRTDTRTPAARCRGRGRGRGQRNRLPDRKCRPSRCHIPPDLRGRTVFPVSKHPCPSRDCRISLICRAMPEGCLPEATKGARPLASRWSHLRLFHPGKAQSSTSAMHGARNSAVASGIIIFVRSRLNLRDIPAPYCRTVLTDARDVKACILPESRG